MNGPSPHLSWKELACSDGTPYPTNWRESRAVDLAREFEEIRRLTGGRALTVNSAYRTPTYNKKIGGSQYSQHMQGRALDVRPPAGMPVSVFHMRILQYAQTPQSKIRGIGLYSTFVHIDIRPAPRLVRWSGSGASAPLQARESD
jgi:uncharacterized protein YcbK (DUF882 family)